MKAVERGEEFKGDKKWRGVRKESGEQKKETAKERKIHIRGSRA